MTEDYNDVAGAPQPFKLRVEVGDVVYIKREHSLIYSEWQVAGETSRSWLMLDPGATWQRSDLARYAHKFPKNGKGYVLGTKYEMELSKWAADHRWRIGNLVERVDNPNALLTIARIVGYKELPEEGQ